MRLALLPIPPPRRFATVFVIFISEGMLAQPIPRLVRAEKVHDRGVLYILVSNRRYMQSRPSLIIPDCRNVNPAIYQYSIQRILVEIIYFFSINFYEFHYSLINFVLSPIIQVDQHDARIEIFSAGGQLDVV